MPTVGEMLEANREHGTGNGKIPIYSNEQINAQWAIEHPAQAAAGQTGNITGYSRWFPTENTTTDPIEYKLWDWIGTPNREDRPESGWKAQNLYYSSFGIIALSPPYNIFNRLLPGWKERIIYRLPILNSITKAQYVDAMGKPLYIAWRRDSFRDSAIAYQFSNAKIAHPERSDIDCLVFAIIGNDISTPALTNRWYAATRQGPTYGTYWEIIDLAKSRGSRTAQEILNALSGDATATLQEMNQHAADLDHLNNNLRIGAFVLSAGLITLGVALAAATPATSAIAGTGGSVADTAPISVTVISDTVTSTPAILAPTAAVALPSTVAVGTTLGTIAGAGAVDLAKQMVENAIKPAESTPQSNIPSDTSTSADSKPDDTGTWIGAILTGLAALLFFL